jgi:hypothetical protein
MPLCTDRLFEQRQEILCRYSAGWQQSPDCRSAAVLRRRRLAVARTGQQRADQLPGAAQLVAVASFPALPPSAAPRATTARVSLPLLSATSSSMASPLLAAKGRARVTLRWLISAR